jgi:hypothetical protein
MRFPYLHRHGIACCRCTGMVSGSHHRTLISHSQRFRMVGSYSDRQGTCLCNPVSVGIVCPRCPKEGEISAPVCAKKALEHSKVEMSHCCNMRSYSCKSSMSCGGMSDRQPDHRSGKATRSSQGGLACCFVY